MDREAARLRFKALRTEGGRVAPQELDEIWAALDIVRPAEILGQWKGSEFDNGHPLCGTLASLGWYGKRFDSVLDAKPLIMHGPDGELYSDVEIGKGEGATLVAGGSALTGKSDTWDYSKGFFHQPTVFADVRPDMRIAQEEIFGPVTAVIPCDSLEEAISIGNGVRYGLSSSIYTNNVRNAFVAMRDMDTGIFYVNAPTIGAETHLPFGGTKETGNGHREAGVAGIDVFSEWKSCYVDYSGSLQRAQIDTEEI